MSDLASDPPSSSMDVAVEDDSSSDAGSDAEVGEIRETGVTFEQAISAQITFLKKHM